MTQYVQRRAVGLDPAQMTVTAFWAPSNQRSSTVTVQVAYPVQPITALFWSDLTINLTDSSSMVVEN